MKTLYLDIFSGISGDMFLGALIDLGVDVHQLEHELEKLDLHGYHLHAGREQKSGIEGIKFDVHLESDHHHEHKHENHGHHHEPHAHGHGHEHHEHSAVHEHHHDDQHDHAHGPGDDGHAPGRNFAKIKKLIARSGLSDWVKQKAISIFQRIAEAEGKIHGQPPENVHFHEVGAVDSIVDIVGACIALELLGKPRVLSAPVTEGTGWIDCAHGRFPIPAPATLEILGRRGVGISQCDEPHELVTPTGAALLAEWAESFAPMRDFVALKIGYGLGTRDNKSRPNVLRALLGETASGVATHDWETDVIVTLQTNLDDINAEILGCFVERALGAGALDVFYTPIQMKKNRPGVLLSILCLEAEADKFAEMILRETTAFGLRRTRSERRKLRREIRMIKTPYGEVAVKIGRLDGQVVQVAPEYDSCRQLAEKAGVPLKQVYEAAMRDVNR